MSKVLAHTDSRDFHADRSMKLWGITNVIGRSRQERSSVCKKSAEELSKLELPKPNDTIDKRIHSKALRLEIALNNPIITFDKNYPLGGIELSNTELI